MSLNFFSADAYTADRIYKHDGFSSTILDSFSSPGSTPRGLTWDGNNIYSSDSSLAKIYKHDGFSATILDSFSSPSSSPQGLTWDGTNIYSCDAGSNFIYKHDGFSATITNSFTCTLDDTSGLTWDGSNLYHSDQSKTYKHSGFSGTITDSFSLASTGITWDGTDLYRGDNGGNKLCKQDGFSATILDSFSSPGPLPTGLTNEHIGIPPYPKIVSGEIAPDNSNCKIVFSAAVYSDVSASQTISKDDLILSFSQNGGDATAASISGLYVDSELTTPLASATGYDTVYAKLSISGVPTGAETIEIKPSSGSAIYSAAGSAMPDTETTGVLTLYNVPASIISGAMANDNAYVEIDFSEVVWADSGNTAELTPDSFLVNFQQNGGGISAASINALFQDAGLTTPLASGAGYSTVFAQLLVTSGFATGDETIEIKPKDGSSIYDSSGGAMDAAETTGLLYFHSVGSAVSLNWSTLDPVISALRSIISLFLVSLFGHGLHVFFTDKALFQEVENDLHTRISSLPTSNQALGIELLNFFQRYYGK